MSQIEKVLRKYIDRCSTDEEVLEAAKSELRSKIAELDAQFDRLADAVKHRMRPRMFPDDYALLKIAIAIERAIAEQMELVRRARQIKAAPGVDIKPLHATLDRVERKCGVSRSVNIELCSQLTTVLSSRKHWGNREHT